MKNEPSSEDPSFHVKTIPHFNSLVTSNNLPIYCHGFAISEEANGHFLLTTSEESAIIEQLVQSIKTILDSNNYSYHVIH